MKRALKFLAVFLIAAALTFGGILGLNWKSFSIFLDNRQAFSEGSELVGKTHSLRGLSEFIAENPDHASVASVVVTAPDSAIYYMEDTPRTLGATSNFFILVAYADLFDRGEIDSEELINWSDISHHQLPDIHPSSHRESFNDAKELGWITDDGAITTGHAVRLLAKHNDLALADYLWWQIDHSYWYDLKEQLNIDITDMPMPWSGLYLAIAPGIQEMENEQILENWENTDRNEYRNHVIEQSDQFLRADDTRSKIVDFMSSDRLGNTFMEERDALVLFPQTTAGEMVSVMQQLVAGKLINTEVSETVQEWLRWPMDRQDGITRDFDDYGAMYDSRMGLLNGIDFGTSAYTGDQTVQVVLFDRLPIGFWFHLSSSLMHQDFMQRLIYDPAMIEQMKRVLDRQERSASAAITEPDSQ